MSYAYFNRASRNREALNRLAAEKRRQDMSPAEALETLCRAALAWSNGTTAEQSERIKRAAVVINTVMEERARLPLETPQPKPIQAEMV